MPPVETGTPFGTLLLGLILLLVGIGVLAVLGLVLFSACHNAFGGFFERAAFRKSSLRCREGDKLIEQGDFAGAVQLLGDAFFLKPIRRESELLSDIANYHTGLLSRLLTIADEMGKGRARLPSLADADRLLADRLEIQLDYFHRRSVSHPRRLSSWHRSRRSWRRRCMTASSRWSAWPRR
jgi:hypothetical protein